MDPSTESGSSKVKVECTDPSGLFESVQAVLASRLPLKNLHWKSPTRPARSIESLNIELFPAQTAGDDKRPASKDGTTSEAAVPQRRHQIPGLRQTPYLKIYLLRCDDNDTYKSVSRRALREWIKSHSSSSASQSGGGGGHDNHDAFDWLILHVLQDGDPEDKAAASKWPGRGTTSILEKIKADFNGSSKNAVDRVAQLRLPNAEGKPQDPAVFNDQLNDLVEKMKNGILTSFDLRVSQYEDDIREKDSQRNLPGWNFCTFFILKEGLARGFENMGLLEDALVGYDELMAGLEAAVAGFLAGTSDQHGGGFLTYGKDRLKQVESALEALKSGEKGSESQDLPEDIMGPLDEKYFPLDTSAKPYRDMILASNISVFDFRVYVFSRQLQLLLRAARAPWLQQKEKIHHDKADDLTRLAEICNRAIEFISMAARTLRYDLESGLSTSSVEADDASKKAVIDNFVSSWIYAAASQILTQTATSSLTIPDSSAHRSRRATVGAAAESKKFIAPKRSSSLLGSGRPDVRGSGTPTVTNPPPKAGTEDLASGRGELFQLAKGVLEEMGRYRSWVPQWNDLMVLFDETEETGDALEEVSLDDEDSSKTTATQRSLPSIATLAGIDLPVLQKTLASQSHFDTLREQLTDQIFRHYLAAGRTRSAEAAMTEMAVLKYRQGDYKTAASHLQHLASFYGNSNWTVLEGVVLELQARCVKELGRNEEYVRTVVRLLSQYALHIQSKLSERQKSLLGSSAFRAGSSKVHPYLEDLLRASSSLQREFTVPISSFFGDVQVDPDIVHFEDRDGFQLRLSLRFLLESEIVVDSVKVRLVSAGGLVSNEVWLERTESVTVKSSTTRLTIGSSISLQGKYLVDRIELRAGNLAFTHGGTSTSSAFPPGFRDTEDGDTETRPFIYCYPAPDGLEARLSSPRYINLEESRALEVIIDTGRNDISKGILRVRPATAGLRLRTADTTLIEGDISITVQPESGSIEFAELGPQKSVRFRVPYTVEENHASLSARLEVVYTTDKGKFSYSATNTIDATLPVSVNVQDVFKKQALFSRFTVGPAMSVPLTVLGCEMFNSDAYEAETNLRGPVEFVVFPKQPASILYKIRRKTPPPSSDGARPAPLRLAVKYACLDEECLEEVSRAFREAIGQSPFRDLTRLLTPHIVEIFRGKLSTSDMEAIGLVREIKMVPYSAAKWDEVLQGVGRRAPEVAAWLEKWHSNPMLHLPSPSPSKLTREIVLPVDIPEVEFVLTAELHLQLDRKQHDHHVAAVGQTIPATLTLQHTRRWGRLDTSSSSSSSSSSESTIREVSYELHAHADQWLIGGRRRGTYTIQPQDEEDKAQSFPIILLPQKPGYLLLPSLEVKVFESTTTTTSSSFSASATAAAAAGAAAQRKVVTSEVDYRSRAETVLVMPDLRMVTLTVPAEGTTHHHPTTMTTTSAGTATSRPTSRPGTGGGGGGHGGGNAPAAVAQVVASERWIYIPYKP